jgi:hypothetical protein
MVSNGSQLRELGVKLQGASNGGLRRELRAGIRAGAAPLVEDVRRAAREKLPKGGGLNEFVANSKITVSVPLAGRNASVRLINSRQSKRGGIRDFGSDLGRVRHPVFGHRKRKWAETVVTPGWYFETLRHGVDSVRPFVLAAMNKTAADVCKL